MALATAPQPKFAKRAPPRIAPPIPARSRLNDLKAIADGIGVDLMWWQALASRYLTAISGDRWLYPEVCFVVSRQNGKTELLVPRIIDDLRRGRRVLHTAQNRTLPRTVFMRVARALDLGEVIAIRYANGQEAIEMVNGGRYEIVAPQRGARGRSGDTLIFDEIREFQDWDMLAAAGPILTASKDPQTIFLSNAGDEMSVVLNDLRRRATEENDPSLAYVEWSPDPSRAIDDRLGWVEANPALAYFPHMWGTLEQHRRAWPPAQFETEHLCRWVRHMRPRVVNLEVWDRGRTADLETGLRPFMGIGVGPDASRVSVAMAWQASDGIVELDIVEDITDNLDLDKLGPSLRERARKAGVAQIAFASWTDAALARYLPNAKSVDGKEFANASVNFARLVDSGFIRWRGADTISNDLSWLARKAHESGAWQATPIDDEHSTTAALAAIRAVWLAAAPKPPAPRIG